MSAPAPATPRVFNQSGLETSSSMSLLYLGQGAPLDGGHSPRRLDCPVTDLFSTCFSALGRYWEQIHEREHARVIE